MNYRGILGSCSEFPNKGPKQQSIFLLGAKQMGNSLFLKENYPEALYYDLLDTRQLMKLIRSPHLLREELLAQKDKVLAHPIIIDEIQKAPNLLTEVYWLIENANAQYILCGSSA